MAEIRPLYHLQVPQLFQLDVISEASTVEYNYPAVTRIKPRPRTLNQTLSAASASRFGALDFLKPPNSFLTPRLLEHCSFGAQRHSRVRFSPCTGLH